jgi:hypothetical protein
MTAKRGLDTSTENQTPGLQLISCIVIKANVALVMHCKSKLKVLP